ncbi:ovalbumin-related protein X-like [Cochliomyia hominivorax]
MTKEFRKNDYILNVLLFIIVLFNFSLTSSTRDVVHDLNNFELNLFYKLDISLPDRNLIVTPLSLATLMILLRMSADASVANDIDQIFGLMGLSDGGLMEGYRNLLERNKRKKLFSIQNKLAITSETTTFVTLRLSGNATFNAWSEYNVCHRSWEYSELNKETKLKLSTETHFKHLVFKYSTDNVLEGQFYTLNGSAYSVNIIEIVGKLKYAELESLQSRVVEIPYWDDDTSLLIFLPFRNNGINRLSKSIVLHSLKYIESKLTLDFVQVFLFNFLTLVDFSLTEQLKTFGLWSIFTRLCDIPHTVKVSEVNYKASFAMSGLSAKKDPFEDIEVPDQNKFHNFHVDHPFMYLLKSSKNGIYLIGKFYDFFNS